jgi:glycosyltransferase involved in cell wall biosynthesis
MVRTAFVSTYPPRLCGIATFTADLGLVAGDREIVALSPPDHALGYAGEVEHVIRRDVLSDYVRVASRLTQCVDVVSIQHEYGIWGGRDGDSVVGFARSLGVPAVATLHTILRKPTAHQRTVLVELVDAVSATVVMSRSAADLLTAAYGVDPLRVEIIPHGVADLPLVRSESVKPSVGLAGRRVILSFGLLGPGKGYELALEALPAVAAAYPDVCYVIVGATHPDMVRREGEAYRQSLVERVERLGLWGNVRFVDRFVDRAELARWLESADVFVTPYPNLEQIVSGTLSSAMGAGRAIVSTPYTYAAELLANGKGVLVAPGSSAALGAALVSLLADDRRRAELGRRAYAHSRGMVWAESGGRYRRLFERVAATTRTPDAAVGPRAAILA